MAEAAAGDFGNRLSGGPDVDPPVSYRDIAFPGQFCLIDVGKGYRDAISEPVADGQAEPVPFCCIRSVFHRRDFDPGGFPVNDQPADRFLDDIGRRKQVADCIQDLRDPVSGYFFGIRTAEQLTVRVRLLPRGKDFFFRYVKGVSKPVFCEALPVEYLGGPVGIMEQEAQP